MNVQKKNYLEKSKWTELNSWWLCYSPKSVFTDTGLNFGNIKH